MTGYPNIKDLDTKAGSGQRIQLLVYSLKEDLYKEDLVMKTYKEFMKFELYGFVQ